MVAALSPPSVVARGVAEEACGPAPPTAPRQNLVSACSGACAPGQVNSSWSAGVHCCCCCCCILGRGFAVLLVAPAAAPADCS